MADDVVATREVAMATRRLRLQLTAGATYMYVVVLGTGLFLQCFDAVGWAAERASGL